MTITSITEVWYCKCGHELDDHSRVEIVVYQGSVKCPKCKQLIGPRDIIYVSYYNQTYCDFKLESDRYVML